MHVRAYVHACTCVCACVSVMYVCVCVFLNFNGNYFPAIYSRLHPCWSKPALPV